MQIYFLLTENCNLNCSMCIRGRQHGVSMDTETLLQVVEQNDFTNDDLVVTGGEPTIHKQYESIVRLLAKNSKTVTVTSNGTLDLKIESLRNIDNLCYQISLDGYKNTHNRIRGDNAYERAWESITKMDYLGVKYSVASVVSRKNCTEIMELLPELESLNNLRYWRVSYEMPFGSASGIEDMMGADEWNIFVDNLLSKAQLRLKIKKLFPFELYERRKEELEKIISQNRIINCGSGVNKLYVYPDFKVYPCTCLTDFCVGDLRKERLEVILQGKSIQDFSNYKLNMDSECHNCQFVKFCNGGCIGMSYHYFGKIGMGDIRCPKLKK